MIINRVSETEMSGFHVIYSGSVLFETIHNYGISHFLEHLMCNKLRVLYEDFDRYSIDFNAYTSNTEVVFYMTGLDKYINRFKYHFLDALLNFEITEKDFNNEKKIVLEEYTDSFQNQSECHYQNTLRKKYRHYSPIGERKAIKKLKLSDIVEYHSKYFSKPTHIVNISKHNTLELNMEFNDLKIDRFNVIDHKPTIEKTMDFDKISILGNQYITDDFINVKFLAVLLGGSLSAPLVNEIREKAGLTYNVLVSFDRLSANEAIFYTNVITDPKNELAVMRLYKKVLSNPSEYITRERFDIVMESFLISKTKNEIFNYMYISDIINSDMNVILNLEKITYDGILHTFEKYLRFDKINWSVF